MGHNALMAFVRLYVCLIHDMKSRMEGLTKLIFGVKEAHDIGDL